MRAIPALAPQRAAPGAFRPAVSIDGLSAGTGATTLRAGRASCSRGRRVHFNHSPSDPVQGPTMPLRSVRVRLLTILAVVPSLGLGAIVARAAAPQPGPPLTI